MVGPNEKYQRNENMKKTSALKKKIARIILIIAMISWTAATTLHAATVEWDVVDGGGGMATTGGGNTLWGSINQTATFVSSSGGTNEEFVGYKVQLPEHANVDCQNGGACAGLPTYYGTANATFTFRNAACGAAPCAFNRAGTQYYRFVWTQDTATNCDSTDMNSGSTWSDNNYFCPGGTCDELGTSMTQTATIDGAWYLCVRSFNGGIIGTDQILGPYYYDNAGPTVTNLDANTVDYIDSFVDGTFNLTADVQDLVSRLKDGTCKYKCTGTGGLCDASGTWRNASDDWSGTATTNGTCTGSNITCTVNKDAITLQMRVQDNANNTGTSITINRTCDTQPPTNTSIGPGADVFQTSTTVTNSGSGLVCSDGAGESGIHASTPYDVEICNDGDTKGGCTSGSGAWVDGNTVNWSANNYDTTTGAAGNWYRFRGVCRDNVENAAAAASYAYSTGYVLIDTTDPNAITSCSNITLRDTSGGTALTWGNSYNYDQPTGPFMEWSDPGDLPAGSNNSGVKGYYVYFGDTSSADPETSGTYQTALNFTNPTSLSSGTSYYFKIKVVDNADNVSASSPACEYKYSVGAYLHISQIDSDGADDPEGVLAPDNSDYELVEFKVLDENDTLITSGPLSTKSIDIDLGNLGTTGAYIYETHAGLTGGTPTSVTVSLSGGQGWAKIMANGTEAPDAITVTPSVNGAGLSAIGGHDQVVYLLVRDETTLAWEIDTSVDDFALAETNDLIINPVWSHAGDKVAYLTHAGGTWNIYMKEYSGSWGGAIRLTHADMNLLAHAAFTWSADDNFIIFSAGNDTDGNEPELYAVTTSDNGSVGDDAGKDLADLRSENKLLTAQAYSSAARRRWSDADWSNPNPTCTNAYADSIVSAMAHIDNGSVKGADLYVVNGSKTGGLYVEGSGAAVNQLTNFPESPEFQYVMHPRWSHDCSKIVFTLVDGVMPITGAYSKAGIYILNLTDSAWGSVASLPITSTSDTGLYLIHECTASTCSDNPAVFPSFSADDTFVIYSVDTTHTFNIRGLQQDDIKGEFYTGKNFDNYAVYIQDQPNYVSQEVGQSASNEFALMQCAGASCPDNADGNPFVFVTQSTATQGDLRLMYLGTESAVTDAGGLMFIEGAVAAVIPPGALKSETMLEVEDNGPFADPGSPDGEALLVDTGIAREFFPDGVIFDEDVFLIFHYCDTDGDGYLDNRQNADCSGATGGNSSLDENKLYVYYWCDAGTGTSRNCTDSTWEKLNGAIDPSKNMITVVTNHFSLYDVKALMRGLAAPQVVRELHLSNPHTYPNPWHLGDGMIYFNIDGDSSFNTQAEGAAGNLQVTVNIYDIRGKHVKTVNNTLTGLATLAGAIDGSLSSSGRGVDLASWDATNNAGRNVASGVYLYHISVSDGVYSRDVTGKLAVVR